MLLRTSQQLLRASSDRCFRLLKQRSGLSDSLNRTSDQLLFEVTKLVKPIGPVGSAFQISFFVLRHARLPEAGAPGTCNVPLSLVVKA
jgi:hypothetical protein